MKLTARDVLVALITAALTAGFVVIPLVHEQVSTEALLAFAGGMFGTGFAVVSALALVHYCRRAGEREEIDAIDWQLEQCSILLDVAVARMESGELGDAQGAVSLALDIFESIRRILSRSTYPHLGLVNTSVSIDILMADDTLRRAVNLPQETWGDWIMPPLKVLAAMSKVMRKSLRNPSDNAVDPDKIRFKLPETP